MSLDPITIEVVLNRVRETTTAMAHALFHSGYSPILRESQDGTAGLTDAAGRVIMVGGGIQYHSLLYTKSVQSLFAAQPVASLEEGDAFVCNDPYKAGNSHVPDMVVAAPVFYDGQIIAFGVSVAHKADVGGLVPGSSGAAAREIFHDGLLLPPIRYWTRDGVVPEVEAIIRSNSRIPEVVIGDLRGQVGATRLGAARLKELCDEYGLDTVLEATQSLLTRTTARVKDAIAKWPDGAAESEGFLDHDGADTAKPVRIHVQAIKKGDRLLLDFSGTDGQTRGPVNTTGATAQSVSVLAVIAASDPSIPINAGAFAAVDFTLPEGKVVNPVFPATVNHYFPTAHLTYNCVLAALGKLNPTRAVAPSGLGNGAIAIGYLRGRDGQRTVQYELMTTGLGGNSEHDGTPIVMGVCHFTPGTPVEIVETEYPIMIRRFDTWQDSAGAGKQRGGIGFVREYELLSDCILTARTANHRKGGWGLNGGKGPPLCRTTVNPDTPDLVELECLDTRECAAGTVVRLEQCGGSGYGDPLERPVDAVMKDVRNGYVSSGAAAKEYGVVVENDAVVEDGTARLRSKLQRVSLTQQRDLLSD